MKSAKGEVLYVGKAQNLSSRVRSYFGRSPDSRPQVPFIQRRVTDIECILTNTEKEALILEDSLIKKYRPRYNVMMRDDKSFLSIRIDLNQKFPRPQMVRFREVRKDKARYFGPYSSARSIRKTMQLIHRIFPVRTCGDVKLKSHKSRPCLEYQIKRCCGPCCNLVSEEEYRRIIDHVVMFLEGKNTELLDFLRRRMRQESDQLNFEEAGRIHRQIQAIEHVIETQQVVSTKFINRDIFGLYREADEVLLQIMHVRGGKFTENTTESFSRIYAADDEVISSYMTQFYLHGGYIPYEIILPVRLSDEGAMTELLSGRRGKKAHIFSPERGQKKRLVELAFKNAKNAFVAIKDRAAIRRSTLEQLKRRFRLSAIPHRIECFDISNIRGTLAVASMVVFIDGEKEKSLYRKYRIKSVSQPDDYAMMKEVLSRRYIRGIKEGDLPDLIVVDGGKGHLNICLDILKQLGLTDLNVISIAKDKSSWQETKQTAEKIYLPGMKNPVALKKNSPALYLVQRIRDEAHRFAITYHKNLRKKSALRSVLDEIKGIGPQRKKMLLKHFGSLKRISQASLDQLETAPGISANLARTLYNALHPHNQPKP